MLYLAESKKIVMVGIPGVGKTTLVSKIVEILKDHEKSVSVTSFGTLMFEIAKENGVKDRMSEIYIKSMMRNNKKQN